MRATDIRRAMRGTASALAVVLLCTGLAACSSSSRTSKPKVAHINEKTKFSSAEYGVKASPRVTTALRTKKGGGRDMVGKPYRVRGKWYVPKEEPNYDKAGLASWYGPNFHGRLTANGEVYDQFHLSAAHPTFPLPSYARVTNKKNGRSVIVRVNDRGPYAHGRIIDVSTKAADLLSMKRDGVAAVRVEFVGRAPLEGDDTPYLLASYRGPDAPAPQDAYGSSGVMLAMNGAQPAAPAGLIAAEPAATLPGVKRTLLPPGAILAGMTGGAPVRQVARAAMVPPTPVSVPQTLVAPQGLVSTGQEIPLPAGFALPDIGPIPGDRPSLLVPIAMATPKGMNDIGLAYRGDRVTARTSAFAAILTGGDTTSR